MGVVKAWMMELQERGYGESDHAICNACVTDQFLLKWIADNATATACSFCEANATSPIAASFEDFTGVILGGIGFDWKSPQTKGSCILPPRAGGRRR
jgi:hypothetical protein